MPQEDIRWQLRYKSYCSALNRMEEFVPRFNELDELQKDGLVHRFEFTFELAWKVMQDYLTSSGYNDLKGPRQSIMQMAKDGFIDPFVWQEILDGRNEISHIYKEERSHELLIKIVKDFLPVLQQFREKMAKAV